MGITGAADVLTVANWYVGTANKIEQIRLADGTVIGASAAPLSLTSLRTPIGRTTRLADPSASAWTQENASLQSSTQSLVQAMAQFNAETAADTPWIARRHWDQEPLLLTPS